MVERITITMKKDMLRRIDNMVDRRVIRNRSHAIENLLTKSLNKSGIDTALVMAGGEKIRLSGDSMPKPLIHIHGKPILEHQINFLKKYDIRNIILSVSQEHDNIVEHFGNGSRFDVDINYIAEKKPLGTAGSIHLMRDYVSDSFAMLNVDTLMNLNIAEMYEFHKKEGTIATVMLVTVDDPSTFGVAKMRGNRILGFVGKPSFKNAPSKLVHAGFCIFEPEVMKFVPRERFMIEDLFQRLAKKGEIAGFVHDGVVFDVGTPQGYEKAVKGWRT